MFLGIDIGSRFIKVVALSGDGIEDIRVEDTGFNPHERSLQLIKRYAAERIIATGYGRHFARDDFADGIITEIKAHAVGNRYLFGGCRTVIDIGGQDSKVIALDKDGKVIDFQMNDRCAAGTGKFLEIMAKSLGFGLNEFGIEALSSDEPVKVNSMCTVFAESEVISLLAKKINPRSISLGLHYSIIERISSMLNRVGISDDVVLSGGVGRNPCIKELLSKKLSRQVFVHSNPEIAGALGAALVARNSC